MQAYVVGCSKTEPFTNAQGQQVNVDFVTLEVLQDHDTDRHLGQVLVKMKGPSQLWATIKDLRATNKLPGKFEIETEQIAAPDRRGNMIFQTGVKNIHPVGPAK